MDGRSLNVGPFLRRYHVIWFRFFPGSVRGYIRMVTPIRYRLDQPQIDALVLPLDQ